jgi:hypothetical protein
MFLFTRRHISHHGVLLFRCLCVSLTLGGQVGLEAPQCHVEDSGEEGVDAALVCVCLCVCVFVGLLVG